MKGVTLTQDYISYIRSKVGHDKVILTFAGGILANAEGKVLLQLRADKKTWAIPGGAMELGESSAETCRREFYEETGITVEPLRLLNVYTNFEETYPNGDKVQTVVMLYEVIAKADKAITDYQNDETLRLGYFSREEIAELSSISDKHRLMLAEYFAGEFQMGH
ncbi:NUDIX hydrolase [Streptococcus equi]|uniref:NUDIX hydrolase n=1 Tax=Streptococcus equi TaxID=1336 RepID=UPI0027E112AF|nr:NUDIX hydrolase [Streptococcus equi]